MLLFEPEIENLVATGIAYNDRPALQRRPQAGRLAAAARRRSVPLQVAQSLIIVVATVLLRVAVMNSADVVLCDFIETRHNEQTGIMKDIAAAADGIALFAWLRVPGFEV